MNRGRWHVKCINWGVADPAAPRGLSYLLTENGAQLTAFSPTWEEALERARILADAYPWTAVGRL